MTQLPFTGVKYQLPSYAYYPWQKGISLKLAAFLRAMYTLFPTRNSIYLRSIWELYECFVNVLTNCTVFSVTLNANPVRHPNLYLPRLPKR